jgi:hypothetical protein
MTTKREIYHILFNKFTFEGHIRCDEYQLEVETAIGKTPQSITVREDRVIVIFTDGCRHVFPYTDTVEFFDRPIVKKDADKTTDNAQ